MYLWNASTSGAYFYFMAIRKKKVNVGIYRSGFEETVTNNLRSNNIEHEYETIKLKYIIPSTNHTYTPDVILKNGIICELKGYMDASVRKKMLLVISQNPELDIRLVFMNPRTKITKKSKTDYSMWATKNNIKWGVQTDILNWAKE